MFRRIIITILTFLLVLQAGMVSMAKENPLAVEMEDGTYSIVVDLEGGSGKASILSPTYLLIKEKKAYARLLWSSPNYDYMVVGNERYDNLSEENENSSFEIPISCFDQPMDVVADTTAMGTPHEVEYTLYFYQDSIGSVGQIPQEAAKRVVYLALAIIVGGGILNAYVKRKRR